MVAARLRVFCCLVSAAAVCEGRLLGQRSFSSWGLERETASANRTAEGEAERAGGTCSLVTGGSCYIFGCEETRGPVDCFSGHCLCKTGYCAVNGVCQLAPSKGSDLKRTAAPIRLMAHPDKCLVPAGTDPGSMVSVQACGTTPPMYALPIGGTGQIQIAGNDTACMGVINIAGVQLLGIVECDLKLGSLIQFVIPGGAMGLIRWNFEPHRCFAVLEPLLPPPPPWVPPPAAVPGVPPTPVPEVTPPPKPDYVGAQITLSACSDKNNLQMFGAGDEAPAPFQPCDTSEGCAHMEAKSVLTFCLQFPYSPTCTQFRRCPPGGCNNGACVSGYCACNAGFTGDSCEEALMGEVPLATAISLPGR